MRRNRTARSPIVVFGLVVLLALVGCQQPPSPDELAQEALEAATAGEQELAAVKLAEVANDNQLQPQLRQQAKQCLQRVLKESRSPQVRAACIQGLSSLWDYDSMPAFLDALGDESDLVRGRAVVTIERMMSVSLAGFGYRYDDPSAKRAPAIERVRKEWDTTRDSPIMKKWRERLKEKS